MFFAVNGLTIECGKNCSICDVGSWLRARVWFTFPIDWTNHWIEKLKLWFCSRQQKKKVDFSRRHLTTVNKFSVDEYRSWKKWRHMNHMNTNLPVDVAVSQFAPKTIGWRQIAPLQNDAKWSKMKFSQLLVCNHWSILLQWLNILCSLNTINRII